MRRFLISAALVAATLATPAAARDRRPMDVCPGAELNRADYAGNIDRNPPVQVIMAAVRALNACRKAGLNVPYTVDEYTRKLANLPATPTVDAREIDRALNPLGRPYWER